MSGTSLLFVVPAEYEMDEIIEIEVSVNPLFLIRCAVRIARRAPADEGMWAHGAVFHNLSASDAEVLGRTLISIQAGVDDDSLSFRPKMPLAAK